MHIFNMFLGYFDNKKSPFEISLKWAKKRAYYIFVICSLYYSVILCALFHISWASAFICSGVFLVISLFPFDILWQALKGSVSDQSLGYPLGVSYILPRLHNLFVCLYLPKHYSSRFKVSSYVVPGNYKIYNKYLRQKWFCF